MPRASGPQVVKLNFEIRQGEGVLKTRSNTIDVLKYLYAAAGKQWARTIKCDAVAVWIAARDPRVPWYAKLVAAAVHSVP